MRNRRLALPEPLCNVIEDIRALSAEEIRQMKEAKARRAYRIIIVSDMHGVLLDRTAFSTFLSVLRNGPSFQELILNGDILDLPRLSRHISKYHWEHPMLESYTESNEIQFTRKHILAPIVEAVMGRGEPVKIIFRNGNHEERITNPIRSEAVAMKLVDLNREYGTMRLNELLELHKLGIEYDPTPRRSYLSNRFNIVHGVSVAQNAPRSNMLSMMESGASGHTHRLNITTRNTLRGPIFWIENGCLRTMDDVEYLPTAAKTDWNSGFSTIDIYKTADEPHISPNIHLISNGVCVFDGQVFTA